MPMKLRDNVSRIYAIFKDLETSFLEIQSVHEILERKKIAISLFLKRPKWPMRPMKILLPECCLVFGNKKTKLI